MGNRQELDAAMLQPPKLRMGLIIREFEIQSHDHLAPRDLAGLGKARIRSTVRHITRPEYARTQRAMPNIRNNDNNLQ